MRHKTIGRKMRKPKRGVTMRRKTMRRKTMRRKTMRRKTMRRTNNRRTNAQKLIRGGTVNPMSELGNMFTTIGSSLQNVMTSLHVPITPGYNPSLPISASPSSQFITNELTQPISTIYNSR